MPRNRVKHKEMEIEREDEIGVREGKSDKRKKKKETRRRET